MSPPTRLPRPTSEGTGCAVLRTAYGYQFPCPKPFPFPFPGPVKVVDVVDVVATGLGDVAAAHAIGNGRGDLLEVRGREIGVAIARVDDRLLCAHGE